MPRARGQLLVDNGSGDRCTTVPTPDARVSVKRCRRSATVENVEQAKAHFEPAVGEPVVPMSTAIGQGIYHSGKNRPGRFRYRG